MITNAQLTEIQCKQNIEQTVSTISKVPDGRNLVIVIEYLYLRLFVFLCLILSSIKVFELIRKSSCDAVEKIRSLVALLLLLR